MSSSTPALAKAHAEKPTFEVVAKAITYALPFVYVCGFVVLSLFEAEYGIVDFSLIKVKAVAAGLLFAVFMAYPAIVSIRAFQLLGLKKPGSNLVEVGSEANHPYFSIIKICELFVLSEFSALALVFFFRTTPTVWLFNSPNYLAGGHFSALAFSLVVCAFASLMLGLNLGMGKLLAKHFRTRPRSCAILVFLNSVLWAIWTFQLSDHLFFSLVGWCYLVGLASITVAWLLGEGESLKARDWEIAAILSFSVLVPWFATGLYGRIKPAFGGGAPVEANLYLKENIPPFTTKSLNVLIIEETEQGFYVLNGTVGSKAATFVPRENVSTVQFNSSEPKK